MRIRLLVVVGAALAGCGGNNGARLPDSGSRDANANADASVVDGPLMPVTLTITSADGTGNMGVTVYFQNVDSTLVAEMTTDAAGVASVVMAAGGYVTALVPLSEPMFAAAFRQVQIETFAGVKPGDHLVLGASASTGDQEVNFATGLSSLGGAGYVVFTTCDTTPVTQPDPGTTLSAGGMATETGATELPSACTTANVSVWAQQAGSFLVSTETAMAITANTDIATTYVAPSAVSVSYSDVPAAITDINVSQSLNTIAGTLPALVTTPAMTVTAGAASGTLYQTTLMNAKALTVTTPDFGVGAIGDQQIIELAATSATYALDVGMNALYEYATTPTYDVATHSVGWTEGAAGVAPDLSISVLGIERTSGDTENEWLWSLAAPRDDTTAAFPVLPTDIYDYNAGATDSITVVGVDEFKVPGGYDTLRASVFSNVDPVVVLGPTGKASHQSIAGGGPEVMATRAHRRWFSPPPLAAAR